MARRRYISTTTSTDKVVNKLATRHGDFATLLYLLMIPHAEDDGTLTGDPEELLAVVLPMRRDKSVGDVAEALEAMAALGLVEWNKERSLILFPVESFYRYQTYIKPANRRGSTCFDADEQRQSSQDTDDRRKTPQNTASPSLPPSHSHSPTHSPSARGSGAEASAGSEKPAYDPGANGRLFAEKKELMEEFPWWEKALDEATPENVKHKLRYQCTIWRDWVENPENAPKEPAPTPPLSEYDQQLLVANDVRASNPRRPDERTDDYTQRLSGLIQREIAARSAVSTSHRPRLGGLPH